MSRLIGGILVAVGILIMTCSGLCSLVVVVSGFPAVFRDPSMILFPLIFGGLPFVAGFGLYRTGRYLIEHADDPPYH